MNHRSKSLRIRELINRINTQLNWQMHDVGKMRKTKPCCAVKLSCNNSTTLISVLLYRECVIYPGNKQHRHLCQKLPGVLKSDSVEATVKNVEGIFLDYSGQ